MLYCCSEASLHFLFSVSGIRSWPTFDISVFLSPTGLGVPCRLLVKQRSLLYHLQLQYVCIEFIQWLGGLVRDSLHFYNFTISNSLCPWAMVITNISYYFPLSILGETQVSTGWTWASALLSLWAGFLWTLTRECTSGVESTLGVSQTCPLTFPWCQGQRVIFLGSYHVNLLASFLLNSMRQSVFTLYWPSINLASWSPSNYSPA